MLISVDLPQPLGPNIDTITDTLTRAINFHYDTNNRLISISGPGYNNTTRTYVDLAYKQLTLSYAFASGLTTDTATDTPYVLKAIYYPGTNTGYWFDDSNSYSSYGMIAKVVQERGMSFFPGVPGSQGNISSGPMTDEKDYNFPMVADSSWTDAPLYTTLTEDWAAKDTSVAVTSYSDTKTTTDEIITVTLPDNSVNKQTSHIDPGNPDDGMYYQGEIYASSTASTPLAKTKTFLGNGDYGTSRPTRVEVTDELGQTTATDFSYATSSYNQRITQKQYAYGGTTLYRQTVNTYDNYSGYISRHIFNLLKSTESEDASGTPLTRTEYQYDNNAEVSGTGSPNLTAAAGVVMHNDTSDPFTTNTHLENGACDLWSPSSSEPTCSYDGEEVWVPIAGGYYENCACQEYEQVSVNNYDPNSIFRGT